MKEARTIRTIRTRLRQAAPWQATRSTWDDTRGQGRNPQPFHRNAGGPTAYGKMRWHFYAVQGILPCPGCGAGSPMLFPGGGSIRQRTSDAGARADGGKRELFGQFGQFGRFGQRALRVPVRGFGKAFLTVPPEEMFPPLRPKRPHCLCTVPRKHLKKYS